MTLAQIALAIGVLLVTYIFHRGLALALLAIGAAVLAAFTPACSGAPAPTIITEPNGCRNIVEPSGKLRPVIDVITGAHAGCGKS